MNNKARFSGRQKTMASILTPAEAGSKILLGAVPRAALRSTSFRSACPGLNSAAGYAGSLSGTFRTVVWSSAISLFLVFFAGCSKTTAPERSHGAQTPTPSKVRSSADVVKVIDTNVSIPAGGKSDTTITLSISPGFHVNANPATFSYLIATEVQRLPMIDGYCVAMEKPVYPAAISKAFSFAEKPLAVYEGEVAIKLRLRLTQPGEEGCHARANTGVSFSVPISVRVQACDQEKCFPPDTLHATVAVEVK